MEKSLKWDVDCSWNWINDPGSVAVVVVGTITLISKVGMHV